jgi:Fe-S cluster biogenesis protein NfuA
MTKSLTYNERIESLIDEGVNPALSAHQGFVMLAGTEKGTPNKVVLEFHGGCAGCPASFTFTLKTIENYLREELKDETLIVVNVETL